MVTQPIEGWTMGNAVLIWQTSRALKWIFWLAAAAYYFECAINRTAHQNSFGHLLHTSEFWLFGLPIAAVFAGFMEMSFREKAGLMRPEFLRNWSGKRA
jgi:hypothetical protein